MRYYGVSGMATISFSKPLVIRTDESALALIEAFEDRTNHKSIKRIDIAKHREICLSLLKEKHSPI